MAGVVTLIVSQGCRPLRAEAIIRGRVLTQQQLLEVVGAMVRAKADCTPNDPPGSRGWSAYKMGTRRLREITLVVKGWEKDDTDQIPGVINKGRGIRIVVANSRYDAAHELGHLVLHQDGKTTGREAEDQANRFAAAFLMPRADVLAVLPIHAERALGKIRSNAFVCRKSAWTTGSSPVVTKEGKRPLSYAEVSAARLCAWHRLAAMSPARPAL